MHRPHERLGNMAICRDDEKVVDEPHEQAALIVDKTERILLQFGVEIAAQQT